MPLDLQITLVVTIVAAAAGYLVFTAWRTWRRSGKSCGGDSCACAGPAEPAKGAGLIPSDQLTLRRRDAASG